MQGAGFNLDKKFEDLSAAERGRFLDVQQQHEGYKAGDVSKPSNQGTTFKDQIGPQWGGAHAEGGLIGEGKIGLVGEKGPELVSGPGNVIKNETVQALVQAISTIEAMVGNNTKLGQTEEGDYYRYSGTIGGDDFKRERWAEASFGGTLSGGAAFQTEELKKMLVEVLDPTKGDQVSDAGEYHGSSRSYAGLTEIEGVNDQLKTVAENAVRMVEEMRRVSDAMHENNRISGKILQNSM
jgi:hypothetical protein